MNKNRLEIGQKIKQFRNRAGISQLELEMRIETSPGSISRIESGEVNPTKETITKISEALDLKPFEMGILFDLRLDFNELPRMLNLAKRLNSLDLSEVLQKAADEIIFELDLNGSVIFLIEDDSLHTKAVTDCWETKLMMKLLNLIKFNLSISLTKETQNFVVKCVKEQKSFTSNKLIDFTKDVINPNLTDLCAKITSHKSGIALPLIYEDRSIGAVLFSKNYEDDFQKDIPILNAFSEYITNAIINAQNYAILKNQLVSSNISNQIKHE